MNNSKILKELIKLSYKGLKKNEVPVACIILKNDKIYSKAYNLKEKYNNPLYHAEIIAITKLCKKIKNWRLDEYEMYVTLKPCSMCQEVIKASRLKNVYYFLNSNNEQIINQTKFKKLEDSDGKLKEILTSFFKSKR